MKKFLNLFTVISAIAVIAMVSSCNKWSGKQTKSQTISGMSKAVKSSKPLQKRQGPILMIEEDLESLEKYLDNEWIMKNIHVWNSASFSFTGGEKETTTNTTGDTLTGRVKTQKEESKLVIFGILPAYTEGEIVKIVRFSNTRNIHRFKVKYIIPNVGPYYIWYWRKTNQAGTMHWYQANSSTEDLIINGVSIMRISERSCLKWYFSGTSKTSTETQTFKVISTFDFEKKKVVKTSNAKKDEEEEEEK